jgi:hypothetical protein
MRTIDMHFIGQVIRLIDLPTDTKLTFGQYQGIAAFSERFFFNIFTFVVVVVLNETHALEYSRRPDNNEQQLQKDILEKLDFASLKWKLVGVNISSSLLQLLRHI